MYRNLAKTKDGTLRFLEAGNPAEENEGIKPLLYRNARQGRKMKKNEEATHGRMSKCAAILKTDPRNLEVCRSCRLYVTAFPAGMILQARPFLRSELIAQEESFVAYGGFWLSFCFFSHCCSPWP